MLSNRIFFVPQRQNQNKRRKKLKKAIIGAVLFFLPACSQIVWDEDVSFAAYDSPTDYNYIAAHVNVISKSSRHIVYEYKDVRIDDIAPVAAIYCNNQNGRQANLYNIIRQPDNRRRATFSCD